jgi:hypothetical protein
MRSRYTRVYLPWLTYHSLPCFPLPAPCSLRFESHTAPNYLTTTPSPRCAALRYIPAAHRSTASTPQHGHRDSSPSDGARPKDVTLPEREARPRAADAISEATERTANAFTSSRAPGARHGAAERSHHQPEHEPLPPSTYRLARDHPSSTPIARQHAPGATCTSYYRPLHLPDPCCELSSEWPTRCKQRSAPPQDREAAWRHSGFGF